ncbi:probable galacturonosyltransferase 7 isoform X2 [Aristolochia californica]|uniref:probable galacturonosyltransferase 7 isoform X2 n=1 Tax=Aristolochia californica TaxID=171875 RepID=UPI0035DB225A
MKGAAPVPHKRGWRGFCFPVLSLVLLSLLVPLFFLVNQSGYSVETESPAAVLKRLDVDEHTEVSNLSEEQRDQSRRVDDLMRRLGPSISKEVIESIAKVAISKTSQSTLSTLTALKGTIVESTSLPVPASAATLKSIPGSLINDKTMAGSIPDLSGAAVDETEASCQLEFGSYCLWRDEHKEQMQDSKVKQLKDKLFVARAYYPSVAKLPAQDNLSREMKMNIQEYERMLSEATTDSDIPVHVEEKMQKMAAVISKAKEHVACTSNVDKKFRQLLDLTEDEAHFHMKQSAFLYQLGVHTVPKSLHCLSMRLTVEYFRSHSAGEEDDKHEDPTYHHYVIFSNHILAASVVINSTVMHSEDTANLVFHVVTDGQNYFAMKFWFIRHKYKNATVDVLNIDDLNLKHMEESVSHLLVHEEFRVSIRSASAENLSAIQTRTEYISVFGSTHFLLPEIFPNLKRVVVLGDDVVVKRDLSPLWSLDMEGMVNGAVEYCGVRHGQLRRYLGQSILDSNSCAWMSGLNVINLERWRESNLTETYRRHLMQQQQNGDKEFKTAGTLPAYLLAFHNQIYALDNSWALSGLGYNYRVDTELIKKAAVLHYNGNMKPWLDLGIKQYRGYWLEFLTREDQFMDDCYVRLDGKSSGSDAT